MPPFSPLRSQELRPPEQKLLLVTKSLAGLLVTAILAACASQAASDSPRWWRDAPYSVSLGELDSALACRGGMNALDGREHDQPVLLVHGTGTTREQNWGWTYWPALHKEGFEECWVALPHAALNDAQISAEYVARAIDVMNDATGERVDVIGHSQGGLVPRWAIKYFASARFVDDYVGFATPSHGTTAVGASTRERRCFESCWQMHQGSNFLSALNAGDETPGPISYTSIYTRSDELVRPVESAELAGGTNILLQSVCPLRPVEHILMAADAVTWALAVDALTHAGPADADRVGRAMCLRLALPGARLAAKPTRADSSGARYPSEEPPLQPYARRDLQ